MDKDTSFPQKNTLVLGDRLYETSPPLVAGILNVTPDSFYDGGNYLDEREIAGRLEQMASGGADIIDVGAFSSRPGAAPVPEEEEWRRLEKALRLAQKHVPQIPVSVDTYRASVARKAVEGYGVAMINDISGGDMDSGMFRTVAELQVAYVMMHMQGTPATMQEDPHYGNVVQEILTIFSKKIDLLSELGVTNVVLDPGFGFGKTLQHNYQLLNGLQAFRATGLPVMVGVSRKSMIWKVLDTSAEEALTGTIVLHTLALLEGADILRVHDVRAARETIKMVEYWKKTGKDKNVE
jgi:dihydropteroate synthase